VVGGIVIVIGIVVARREGGTRAVADGRQAEAATGA
jgi:hypothetical protein